MSLVDYCIGAVLVAIAACIGWFITVCIFI